MEADSDSIPPLLSFPMPAVAGDSRLRVLEPPDTPISSLCERLLEGSYDKPFIIEHGQLRYLHLGITYVQSVMRIDHPDALDLRYTQKMMSFLLYTQNPRRVVMLGLGGGSLAKFCYKALPETVIVAIEVDPNVIALRRHFAIPEDDARFRVVCADAAEFIAGTAEPIDVLLADAFDDCGLAPSMADRTFLLNAHACLGAEGMLVMNLAGARSRYVDVVESAHEIFDHQTLVVPVEDGENHVLFAFKRQFEHDWPRLTQRARMLKRRCGLDFPAFVQKMQRAHELPAWDSLSPTCP